jgi:hypothetical protein
MRLPRAIKKKIAGNEKNTGAGRYVKIRKNGLSRFTAMYGGVYE